MKRGLLTKSQLVYSIIALSPILSKKDKNKLWAANNADLETLLEELRIAKKEKI